MRKQKTFPFGEEGRCSEQHGLALVDGIGIDLLAHIVHENGAAVAFKRFAQRSSNQTGEVDPHGVQRVVGQCGSTDLQRQRISGSTLKVHLSDCNLFKVGYLYGKPHRRTRTLCQRASRAAVSTLAATHPVYKADGEVKETPRLCR